MGRDIIHVWGGIYMYGEGCMYMGRDIHVWGGGKIGSDRIPNHMQNQQFSGPVTI